MDWSTLVVVAVTAILSFGASQLSSRIQHNRDRDAEERRNQQENDRQAKDLAFRERQAEQERKLHDTLDWRERRLAVFDEVVATSDRCIDLVHRIARDKTAFEGPTGMDGLELELELRRTLGKLDLTGERDVREVGAKLADQYHETLGSAQHVRSSRAHRRAVQKAEDGNEEFQAALAQIADQAPATVEAASEKHQERRAIFRADAQALANCHGALLEVCQRRLGLTD